MNTHDNNPRNKKNRHTHTQIFQYTATKSDIGAQLSSLKQRLDAKGAQAKWDYLIDGMSYKTTSTNDLLNIPNLVSDYTQELKVRVYHGENSNNCVTYVYAFEKPKNAPLMGGGLGGFDTPEAYADHVQKTTLREKELDDLRQQNARLKLRHRAKEKELRDLNIKLAVEESKTADLETRLKSPTPEVAQIANAAIGAIGSHLGGLLGIPTGAPAPSLGSVPQMDEETAQCVRFVENLQSKFGKQFTQVLHIIDALSQSPQYVPDLFAFMPYLDDLPQILEQIREREQRAEQPL